MLPAIDIIPDRRRKLGLTQSQLADLAGVSQSYIAKLEAGKIEPSYLKVKAIFEALDGIERKKEVSANEIMTADVVSVRSDASIHDAVDLMRKHGFSQLPVMNGDKPVGGISERTLLEQMLYPDDDAPPSKRYVRDVMEESFPQVSDDAPLSLLSSLLKYYPAVLVQRKGEVVGIVTKADLLGAIS
ncbi:CBS domain-containing protein [Candidatus Bathyarchaeota archaeon]|nr:CBS domain-containing protein [Candidatus Bathyarchaeota archaeon]